MKPGKHQRPMSLLWFSLSHMIMTVPEENQHDDRSNLNVQRLTLYLPIWWQGWPRWQGWPSGESTCLPPMWPGFDFCTRCHMWIQFVGPLLCHERFFPGYYGFPLSSKTNI